MARKLSLDTEFLDQLQEAIGEWRDGVVFVALVGDVEHKALPFKQPENGL